MVVERPPLTPALPFVSLLQRNQPPQYDDLIPPQDRPDTLHGTLDFPQCHSIARCGVH